MPEHVRYTPVRKSDLVALRNGGLETDREWFETLKAARLSYPRRRLLVVPSGKESAGRITVEDAMNLDPYRPPRYVLAAGGILVRPGPEIAMIYRKGRWDLPKGKRDPGEGKKAGAKREVQEELGIPAVSLIERLPDTVHSYALSRRFVIKKTVWYAMQTKATEFKPQRSEGILAVRWTPLDQAMEEVGFDTLRDLLKRSRKRIKKIASRS